MPLLYLEMSLTHCESMLSSWAEEPEKLSLSVMNALTYAGIPPTTWNRRNSSPILFRTGPSKGVRSLMQFLM